MEKESIFSALSFVATIIYLHVGISAFKQNTKSKINLAFLLLCNSYAIWSFAYSFAYIANSNSVFMIWNKISALGWCSFSAITLFLVLLITENKFANNKICMIIIFVPAALFLYMAVFLFNDGIVTPYWIQKIFYTGNFLYNFIALLISIVLLFLWGIKSESKRIKIQARILVFSSLLPFILNLIMQTILPMMGFKNLPLMGQLFAVILIIGTYIVIYKYKFLVIPENVVCKEVENKIIDMVIVLNEKGQLIKISEHTLNLLGFTEDELLNKKFLLLFDDSSRKKHRIENMMNEEIRFHDIKIKKKNGEIIPVNLHYIPIWDTKINDFLGAAIVMQDIQIEYELGKKNKELYEKTIRDSLTELYNHQYIIELIEIEIKKVNDYDNKIPLSLMMIDIDHFKKVNDIHGHLFGDYVLKTFCEKLVNIIGEKGYIGRFGGEEFIIILPNIEIIKAVELAENFRKEIEDYDFDEYLKLTVSIGVNQFNNITSIDFIKETDDFLYKAKENGRNRVEFNRA